MIARDVVEATGAGERALIEGGGKLRLLDRNGERVLATGTVGAMAITRDGTRAAAQVDDDLVEWDLATGAERVRWPQRRTYGFLYDGAHLYHRPIGQQGGLDRLVEGGAIDTLRGTSSLLLAAPTAAGTVLLGNDGTLALLEGTRAHRFAHDALPIRSIAGSPASTVFAAGMNDGSFRWWDARAIAPAVVPLPRGAMVCAFDARHVYALRGTDAFAIARADGLVRDIGSGMYRDCRVAPGGALGIHMPGAPGQGPMDVIDAATGAATPLPSNAVVDAARGAFVLTPDGKTIVEQAGARRTPRGTAPAPITYLAVAGGWIAAALADTRVLVIDPRGGTQVMNAGAHAGAHADAVAVTPSGIVYIARGRVLLRGTQALATLPSDIVEIAPLARADASVVLHDASIWQASARGVVLRAEPASGQRATALGGTRTAATVEAGHTLVARYRDTGEQLARRMPDLVLQVQVSLDDRETLAQLTNAPPVAMIYAETVPADPAQLPAWLAAATNAVVAHDRDALTWR